MKLTLKQKKLFEKYNKLRKIKIKNFNERTEKEIPDDIIVTERMLIELLYKEIDELRDYIKELKTVSTKLINSFIDKKDE